MSSNSHAVLFYGILNAEDDEDNKEEDALESYTEWEKKRTEIKKRGVQYANVGCTVVGPSYEGLAITGYFHEGYVDGSDLIKSLKDPSQEEIDNLLTVAKENGISGDVGWHLWVYYV